MSLKKIATGLMAVATVLVVGCSEDSSTGSGTAAVKVASGKWVPISSESDVTGKETGTMAGVTETTDTSYTESETYTDTTEILVVTEETLVYYSDEEDSTVKASIPNNLSVEMEKAMKEMMNDAIAEIVDGGGTAEVTKLTITDVSSSVSGDTLTMSYTVNTAMTYTVSMMGIEITGSTEEKRVATDKFIAYEGDVPPSSWPEKVVTGSLF